MARKMGASADADQRNRRLGPQQLDLFGSSASHSVSGAPAWRELPREAQATVVSLMMQLILEHAQRRAVAPGTMEGSHDH
ncbi:hypothetical protein ACD578_26310 (plasmid) [Microvirga sp. RSM25]|uniref:hypothetical protein n=1 Tax=Microvirga sp. RSM25 TaxID=3273802 RepID=UPI0038508F4F